MNEKAPEIKHNRIGMLAATQLFRRWVACNSVAIMKPERKCVVNPYFKMKLVKNTHDCDRCPKKLTDVVEFELEDHSYYGNNIMLCRSCLQDALKLFEEEKS